MFLLPVHFVCTVYERCIVQFPKHSVFCFNGSFFKQKCFVIVGRIFQNRNYQDGFKQGIIVYVSILHSQYHLNHKNACFHFSFIQTRKRLRIIFSNSGIEFVEKAGYFQRAQFLFLFFNFDFGNLGTGFPKNY